MRPTTPTCPRRLTARAGRTLVEMLLVTFIVGLLALVAVARLSRFHDGIAVRAAAGEIAAAVGAAREIAVTARAATVVRIDTARARLVVQRGADVHLARDLRALYAVRIRATRDSAAFDPRGLGRGAANFSVIARRGAAADTVWVSRLGRVRR